MTLPPDHPAGRRRALACPDCTAWLTVEQRYCVACGSRTRPLPRFIAAALASLAAGHRRDGAGVPALNGRPVPAGAIRPRRARRPWGVPVAFPAWQLPAWELPTPRAAAAAVLGVLAFAVAIGSGNASIAASPLTLFLGGGHSGATPLALSSPPSGSGLAPGGGTVAPPASGGTGSGASSGAGAGSAGGGAGANSASAGGQGGGGTSTSTTPAPTNLPPIRHVWVITLGDQGYAQTWASTSPDAYLHRTLIRKGEIVPAYYATATSDLANEVALVSGQGPTNAIVHDCPTYDPIMPGSLAINGQVIGNGCVFPAQADTIFGQLTAAKLTWKVYVQGMGTGSKAHAALGANCAHPGLNHASARTVRGRATYVTWRNPAVYFASVTGTRGCASADVGTDQLARDLGSASRTPTLSVILPDPCHDGSDTGPGTPCPGVHRLRDPAASANGFLRTVLGQITASAAYRDGHGLILVSFAMAAQTGPTATSASQAACCNTPTYLNLADSAPPASSPTTTGTAPPSAAGGASSPTATTSTGATGTATTGTTTAGGTGTATTGTTGTATTATGTTTAGAAGTTATSGTGTGTPTTIGTGATTGTGTTGTTTTRGSGTPTCPASSTSTPPAGAGGPTGTSTSTAPSGTVTFSSGTAPAVTTTITTPATATTTPATATAITTPATAITTPATAITTPATAITTPATATTAPSTTTSPGTGCVPPSTVDQLGNPLTGGGGQVGLLAISKWVTPGAIDQIDAFNHFSLLASLDALFGLKPIGFAAKAVGTFGHYFYSAFTPGG